VATDNLGAQGGSPLVPVTVAGSTAAGRTVWQIGNDDQPNVAPYDPSAEFSMQNGKNDKAPGTVTRIPGDPVYDANPAANPAADDDFYTAGVYPPGFNGLTVPLQVSNDEPSLAWERGHTEGDRTNRIHLQLAADQVGAGSSYRLRMEFTTGGYNSNGVVQPGFGVHDLIIRFRNGLGQTTQIDSRRVTQASTLTVDFNAAAVAATAGPNTVEIVRTGPVVSGVSSWIRYDYVRLELLAGFNGAPALTQPPALQVNEHALLEFSLHATDPDGPEEAMVFELVSGPPGMVVTPGGDLRWIPGEADGPGTHPVVVRVTDSGVPALSDSRSFTVTVNEVAQPLRTEWRIGTDHPPGTSESTASAEFSIQNGRNDVPPGLVTRLPGDPVYDVNPASNPGADDDFYFAGAYPEGFNALNTPLAVLNDEPASAWERGHTEGDRTNRLHWVLTDAHVASGSAFRLHLEFYSGGYNSNSVTQPGFGNHDMVVRFRNGDGASTLLLSQRISQRTNLVVEFTADQVEATAGPNSIEVVRTGPMESGVSSWIRYDHLRLEGLPASP